MLCLIAILGGFCRMMGQHTRSESLFYYFRIEDQVPELAQYDALRTKRPSAVS